MLCRNFEVVCVDLPGHGSTDSNFDGADLDESAALLTSTCGPAIYIGYSLGGRVVLHAALNNPAGVEAAVLIGTKVGFRDESERAARRRSDDALADQIEKLGDDGLCTFIDDWLAQPFNSSLQERAKFREARLQNRAAGLAASLRNAGSGRQEPLWGSLESLTMPVLVIRGENDLPSVVADTDSMEATVGRNVQFAVAPATGHAGPFEKPVLFAQLIEQFLI
jgi:2-succinyl-6-hydroxy-2,4-cyclohexadiene-1-carboxylate synthase